LSTNVALTIMVLTQRYVPTEVENRRWNKGETSGWGDS